MSATTTGLSRILCSVWGRNAIFVLWLAAAAACCMLHAAYPYIQPTKVLPHLTTFDVCCSKPTKEKTSLFLAFFFPNQFDKASLILYNLSVKSLISMRMVSGVIPRKQIVFKGPSTFSSAKGIPKYSHGCSRMSKLFLQVAKLGGPIVRKSSW